MVDDDDGARRLLVRFLKQHRPVRAAATAAEAISQIGGHDDWSGFLIDISLGGHERGGLEVLAAARRVFPSVPAAVVTGSNEKEIINQVAMLSATFLCKPFGAAELTSFLDRVAAADAELPDRLAMRLQAFVRKWNLAPRETDILGWLVSGRTRESYLARSGMSALQWRDGVAQLLKKAGAARTNDLVVMILRDDARDAARRMAAHSAPGSDVDL